MFLFSILVKLLQNSRPKIKQFVQGRKEVLDHIQEFKSKFKEDVAWFHVASLGEYEQSRPVILHFKKKKPEVKIAVSFFSPSGYEHVKRKNKGEADLLLYLPIDTPKNAREFLSELKPKYAFFVKYDLWANYIFEAKRQQIPLYLFSAAMREDQVYFQVFGGFFRKILQSFDHIFTQNERSIDLLHQINISSCTHVGDTRFDRVNQISSSPTRYEEVELFCNNIRTIVLGSVWEADMDVWIPWINSSQGYKFIIAPHDIDQVQIDKWMNQITLQSTKFSSKSPILRNVDVLFIDNIGMLSSLYQYAYIAYVGGAFGKGLHNILEPLAFGIPVLFGELRKPKKFPEACISIEYGASGTIADLEALNTTITALEDPELYEKTCEASRQLVKENLGSARKIVEKVLSS